MKITLSKSQWESIGQKTGWIKEAHKYIIVRENIEDGSVIKDTIDADDMSVASIKLNATNPKSKIGM